MQKKKSRNAENSHRALATVISRQKDHGMCVGTVYRWIQSHFSMFDDDDDDDDNNSDEELEIRFEI